MMTSHSLTAEQLFLDFLASNGHPLDETINCDSSKFHSFKCPQGKSTDARYKFYPDGIQSGYFKCWRCSIEDDFCSKQQHEVTPLEWQTHRERLEEDKKRSELETQQKHAATAELARAIFATAVPNNHGYLTRKQVKNYGLRVVTKENEYTQQAKCYEGTLLVPSYNALDELVNLERIYLDNKDNKYKKRPLVGGQRTGAYYLIGEPTDKQEVILIAEGYSSGATAYEATSYPTAITFNCGNILNVTTILRKKYPHAQLSVIADDDQWNDDPSLRHAGAKAAKKVSSDIKNTTYILPDFSVLNLPDFKLQELKPTDVNDLFVLLLEKGMSRNDALEVIRQQVDFHPKSHHEILDELIKKITQINFRDIAAIDESEKLKSQHYLIITIEQVLKIAVTNNWGICKSHDFIYVYNGAYWSLLDVEELKTFLGTASEAMGVDKFCSRHYDFRDKLYKQFIALANLPKPEQQKDTILINLKNGTFEITPQGTKLNEFKREDFITYQLPFEFTPVANAPIFAAYLDKVLPEKRLQDILAEYLGYVFIQPTTLKLEKTLLLYGTGANGKSVFYEVVRNLLGEQNTSEYSLQSLTNENGYFRAMIANKLVNYASEINGKLEWH